MGLLKTYINFNQNGSISTIGTLQDNGVIYTNPPYIEANLNSDVYYFSPLIIGNIPVFSVGVEPISGAGSHLSIGGGGFRFNGVAVEDSSGNMYLGHRQDGTLAGAIVKFDINTNSTGLFVGNFTAGGSTDGVTTSTRFFALGDMVIDSNDNIFAVDQAGRCIRKITPAGVVTTFAGNASNPTNLYIDGNSTDARFPTYIPSKISIDSDNNIYLVSAVSQARTLRKITSAGAVSTLAGLAGQTGFQDGLGANARFTSPSSLAIDSDKNIYVFDSDNHNLRKVTPNGTVTTFAGISGVQQTCTNSEANPLLCDGIGTGAKFGDTTNQSAIIDQYNNLYFSQNNNIRKVNLNTSEVTTIGGRGGDNDGGISISGTGFDVRFDFISSLKLDQIQSGVILISNLEGSSVVKMKQGGFI